MERVFAFFQRIDRMARRAYALFAAALAFGCAYAAWSMPSGPELSGKKLAGSGLFGLGALLTGWIAYRCISAASSRSDDRA